LGAGAVVVMTKLMRESVVPDKQGQLLPQTLSLAAVGGHQGPPKNCNHSTMEGDDDGAVVEAGAIVVEETYKHLIVAVLEPLAAVAVDIVLPVADENAVNTGNINEIVFEEIWAFSFGYSPETLFKKKFIFSD
jgi:hypothetical protein